MQLKPFKPCSYNVTMSVTKHNNMLALRAELLVKDPSVVSVWPHPLSLPTSQDELYKSTCFELFVQYDHEAYWEVNLAPNHNWQYYFFSHYRHQIKAPCFIHPPYLTTQKFQIKAYLAADIITRPRLKIGLAATIQRRDGSIDYWALRHLKQKPDFHDPQSFLIEL